MAFEQPQLPCGVDGVCMRCKVAVPSVECLTCNTCGTLWHASCLTSPPESLASTQEWGCPDCSGFADHVPVSGTSSEGSVLVTAIRAIEADASLTEAQKAKKRQRLMSGKTDEEEEKEKNSKGEDILNCSICLNLPERPVSTPCGHNFCLKCFQKWVGKGNHTCVICRVNIPENMKMNPRINLSIVNAVRLARVSKCANVANPKVYHHISNQDRPETAYTTERAKKAGKANACSGRTFVTVPRDHFGPITAEHDPTRNKGVLVGETWTDRLHCKQWRAHCQHVAGIAGQSKYGAQSVALSGGYEDDQDHGDWFLYTGSGGRDLKGNKRTNKEQSFDQKFVKSNEALRISCKMGYPVRVVRTHKEKCSSYAPLKEGVRYDGIYRIEKCWRNVGLQNYRVCRYLFIRCDNSPAPWTSDEHGDRPRPLPTFPEPHGVTDLFDRTESPSWDFDETDGRWKWMKPPPASRIADNDLNPSERKIRKKAKKTAQNDNKEILKVLGCQICGKVMSLPVTTPCAHSFCKVCLEDKFAGISQVRERSRGGRTLRPRNNVMSCPRCKYDIAGFLQNPQVNRDLMRLIEDLNKKNDEAVVEKEEEEEEEEDEEEEEEDEPKIVADEVEPQIVVDEDEPKIVDDEVEPQTVVDEDEPKIVADEVEPQIVVDEDEPKIVADEVEPQIVADIVEPQIVVDEDEPKIVADEVEPQIVVDEDEPKIVAEEVEPQIVADEDEPPTKKIKLDTVALSA